jgi:hypothetical protein
MCTCVCVHANFSLGGQDLPLSSTSADFRAEVVTCELGVNFVSQATSPQSLPYKADI